MPIVHGGQLAVISRNRFRSATYVLYWMKLLLVFVFFFGGGGVVRRVLFFMYTVMPPEVCVYVTPRNMLFCFCAVIL